METTVRRFCAGLYYASKGNYKVAITRRDDLNGWMAAAEWDRCLYTDIVPTYQAAKTNALAMLDDMSVPDTKRVRVCAGQYRIGEWTISATEGEDRTPGYQWVVQHTGPDTTVEEFFHTLDAATAYVRTQVTGAPS